MGKHSAEGYTDKNKGIGKLKIILILILCICIFVGIANYIFNEYKKQEPEDIINKFFTAIKEDDKELANNFSNYEELLSSLDDMMLENNIQILNVKKELFKDITWSIENIEIEENKALAIVEVTNKNFKNVITKWMKELVVSKSLGKEVTDGLALEKLEKVLSQESELKTVIKKITLSSDGEKWKIEVDQELRDLVYPGIENVIEVLNTTKGEK